MWNILRNIEEIFAGYNLKLVVECVAEEGGQCVCVILRSYDKPRSL